MTNNNSESNRSKGVGDAIEDLYKLRQKIIHGKDPTITERELYDVQMTLFKYLDSLSSEGDMSNESNKSQGVTMLERLGDIDEKCAQLEDVLHGKDGKLISEIRKELSDIGKSLLSHPSQVGVKEIPMHLFKMSENALVQKFCEHIKGIYHDGAIMQALERFAEWMQSSHPSPEKSSEVTRSEPALKDGEIERIAETLWNKWAANYNGRVWMTKDLFTLALQDKEVYSLLNQKR